MKISIITLFPKMIAPFFEESIVKRAQTKGLVEIEFVNLRDFAVDDYGSVDDKPYGGGAGMLLRVEPIYKALEKLKIKSQKLKIKTKTVLTSPRGVVFTQKRAKEYSALDHLMIIAGHYEGVDERVRQLADEEVSLGDFVLTGGEIAAAVLTDAVVRLLPGVLKKEEARERESFFEAPLAALTAAVGDNPILTRLRERETTHVKLLEYPQYTRPENFRGLTVPKILLTGDHRAIEAWRLTQAFEETLRRRPDLLEENGRV